MRISETPTEYILFKANTDSEWDYCEFAIVQISKIWKEEQLRRMDAVRPFKEDYSFQSMNFYDTSVDFYRQDEDNFDVDELLENKYWAFADIDADELETLTPPENMLDCHTLVIYSGGNAKFKAFGKHTGEEFWTDTFPLQQLLDALPY